MLVQQNESATRIDWANISTELDRARWDCRTQWIALQDFTTKKGKFSPEEDAVIKMRVKEWGSKGRGLYTTIARELNRPKTAIFRRWQTVLR